MLEREQSEGQEGPTKGAEVTGHNGEFMVRGKYKGTEHGNVRINLSLCKYTA